MTWDSRRMLGERKEAAIIGKHKMKTNGNVQITEEFL
jgi:hypothetical protein